MLARHLRKNHRYLPPAVASVWRGYQLTIASSWVHPPPPPRGGLQVNLHVLVREREDEKMRVSGGLTSVNGAGQSSHHELSKNLCARSKYVKVQAARSTNT